MLRLRGAVRLIGGVLTLPSSPSTLPEVAPVDVQIEFVGAPPESTRTADEILKADLRCTDATRCEILLVAKAYIDEGDEVRRSVEEHRTPGVRRRQLSTLSPPEMVEKARRLRAVTLAMLR